MIIGGLQTGNTKWLAAHLQNAADNESVELAEISGTIARDVDGALAEFDAYTLGTRAKEGVYAAYISPPVPLEREQYQRAIALIEERLGLTGQPRIILFHTKAGREHCHIAWSRIDTRRMRAIQLSHDRQKLRRCAQELAAEFGTELPPGLANDRGAERFDDPPQPTGAEKAMEARSGLSREERRHVITNCYRNADSAQSFVNALEAAGFMLARGDRRAYVVIDTAGDIHSLARQIDGAKTSDVKKLLANLPLSQLPLASQAKILMQQRAEAQRDAARVNAKKAQEAQDARDRLKAVQQKRRAALDRLWQAMIIRQMHEWKVLLAHIKAEQERHIARRHWLITGLALYLKKIAVIRQLIEYYETRRKRTQEEHHQALLSGLRRRHDNEKAELRRRYAALARLERREQQSVEKQCEQMARDEEDDEDNFGDSWRYSGIAGYAPWQYPALYQYSPLPPQELQTPLPPALVSFQENSTELTETARPSPPDPALSGFSDNALDITTGASLNLPPTDDSNVGESPAGHGPRHVPPAFPGGP